MTSTQAYPNISLPRLRAALEGRVVAPGDPHYDDLRTVFAGGIDRRPAAIVRPSGAADVARAVALARESGLELAVRSGGDSRARPRGAGGGAVRGPRGTRGLSLA